MSGFFDFIFGNLFFVIIAIGALLRIFGSSKKKEDERNTDQPMDQTNTEKPKSVFEQMKHEIEKHTQQAEQQSKPAPVRQQTTHSSSHRSKTHSSLSMEEQRSKQMEELRRRVSRSTVDEEDSHSGLTKRRNEKSTQRSVSLSKNASVDLKKKLTREGLVESVVMAEVLGPPRALKPYRNVASNRYR